MGYLKAFQSVVSIKYQAYAKLLVSVQCRGKLWIDVSIAVNQTISAGNEEHLPTSAPWEYHLEFIRGAAGEINGQEMPLCNLLIAIMQSDNPFMGNWRGGQPQAYKLRVNVLVAVNGVIPTNNVGPLLVLLPRDCHPIILSWESGEGANSRPGRIREYSRPHTSSPT